MSSQKEPPNHAIIKLFFDRVTPKNISKVVSLFEDKLQVKTKKGQLVKCNEFADNRILIHICKANIIFGFSLDTNLTKYIELIEEITKSGLKIKKKVRLGVRLDFPKVSTLLKNFVNPENYINKITPVSKIEECNSMIIKYGQEYYSLTLSEKRKKADFTDVLTFDGNLPNVLMDKIKEFKTILREYNSMGAK